jgi:hypothetical protein
MSILCLATVTVTVMEIVGYDRQCTSYPDSDDSYTSELCGLVAVQFSVNVVMIVAVICDCCHVFISTLIGTCKLILAAITAWVVWLYHWPPVASWTHTPVAVDALLTVLVLSLAGASRPREDHEPTAAADVDDRELGHPVIA